jgi:hypothetical protein
MTKKKNPIILNPPNNIQLILEDETPNKKRGRKPKGGKITLTTQQTIVKPNPLVNIILHLKCSLNDLIQYDSEKINIITDPLQYMPIIPPEIMTYNDDNAFCLYQGDIDVKNQSNNNFDMQNILFNTQYEKNFTDKKLNYAYNDIHNEFFVCTKCKNTSENENNSDKKESTQEDITNMKDINQKLKSLKINLYKNTLHDKKSACFWCTYDYDNHPCYIPKYHNDGQIYGYGSFCRPECAVAFLMKENIDDSQKFERYHLINQTYGKVYEYNKNIKPAPDPHFILDKFYGNLTIQEYRKLLKSEHMLLVIDKPLTRILPELHEDNDMTNNFIGNTQNLSGVYKVKKQNDKSSGVSKNVILRDKFGV